MTIFTSISQGKIKIVTCFTRQKKLYSLFLRRTQHVTISSFPWELSSEIFTLLRMSLLLIFPAHKYLRCAPAPLWKWCGEAVSKFTVSCLGGCLRADSFSAQWPQDWSTSYMCLLPKTAQQLDSVKKMRPISLLHLGKTFAAFDGWVREDITQRMLPQPQFAYLRGRWQWMPSTGHVACLENASSHRSAVYTASPACWHPSGGYAWKRYAQHRPQTCV